MTAAKLRSRPRVHTYARRALAMKGVLILCADLVVLVIVVVFLWQDGPREVPSFLIGGAVGEVWFLVDRSRLRTNMLAGDRKPFLSEAGPRLRERLLRAYRPTPTVLLTLPYFLAILVYGLWGLPWAPADNWDRHVAAGFVSLLAVIVLANGVQSLYFSYLVSRTEKRI